MMRQHYSGTRCGLCWLCLSDGLDVEPLLTHPFGAGDVAEAFAVASDRGTGSSKVLLKFV
jgi:L-idonate 5-dehydrogenase